MGRSKMILDAETFVTAWQTAATLSEISRKTGKSKGYLTQRSRFFRENGVPLKKFGPATGRPVTTDYAALAKLARKLAR